MKSRFLEQFTEGFMRQMIFFVLVFGLTAMAQDSAPPVQQAQTQVPPKPTCHLFFSTGPCADMWRNYNQALAQRQREELQLYVNRQKAVASSNATAPLQQQIADLNKLTADQQAQIKKLNDQIQSDANAAIQTQTADSAAVLKATSDAHTQGLEQGTGVGAGAMLLLVGVIYGIRRLTVTKKPQTRAASA